MAINKEYIYLDKMSYDDYVSLCDGDEINKYEYVNGTVYMLSRGSDKHMLLGAHLVSLLTILLSDNNNCNCDVAQERSVYLTDEKNNIEIEYIPDVTVKCNNNGDVVPVLVIEILSSGSHKRDLVDKVMIYRDMMVMEYVIVNLEEKLILQYNQPSWEVKGYSSGDIFQSELYPGFRFDVDKFLGFDRDYLTSLITDTVVNNIILKKYNI